MTALQNVLAYFVLTLQQIVLSKNGFSVLIVRIIVLTLQQIVLSKNNFIFFEKKG